MSSTLDNSKNIKRLEKMVGDLAKRFEKASKKSTRYRAASTKLNEATLNLTAKLEAQGKTWKGLGISQKLVTKSMQGNREATERLRNAYKSSTTQTRILGGSFSVLRSKMLLVSFAATTVSMSIGRLTRLFGEQEKAEKKLEVQLGGVSNKLLKFASSQQQVTRFGDEVTISAMATAAAYTKNTDEIKALTEAAMDYAVFSNKDLNTAVMEVSKSVFSSTNLLNRQGIAFEGAVGTSARFENALSAISEKAGGLAKGEGQTLNFALDQMSNAVGDLGENLGTVFVPLVMAASKGIKTFAEFMDENRVKSYTSALMGAATIYGVYAVATGKASAAMVAFNKISKKNLIVFAGMLVVGELINKFKFFSDGTDDLEDSLNNLNTTVAITLAQQQKLDLSSQHLLMVQNGLSELEIKRELNQVKIRQNQEQLEKGTITKIQHETKLNELLIEQFGIEKELQSESIKRITGQLDAFAKLTLAMANFGKESKANAELIKGLQATSIVASTASGAMAAISPPTGAPDLKGWLNFAAVLTTGATQLATLNNAKFEHGGMVGGRRHSQGGTIIEAEQGEFVMSRSAVQAIGVENLNRMNQGGGGGASVIVNISGNVMSQDYVEGELAEQIKEAIRKGNDFGVS